MCASRSMLSTLRRLFVGGIVAGVCVSVVAGDEPAAGTAPPADAPAGEAKMTGDWRLVKLGDDEVPAGANITISVAADGKVSGSTGVNRFFGGPDDAGKKLFGPLGMTRRAGPPEAMAREAAFTTALDEATRFTIDKDRLTLLAGDKPRLVLERVKPKGKEN